MESPYVEAKPNIMYDGDTVKQPRFSVLDQSFSLYGSR